MPLTNQQVVHAKPKDKLYKLSDGRGLNLRVTPKGGKYWIFRYTYAGKENNLSLGSYPKMSLAKARTERDQVRMQH